MTALQVVGGFVLGGVLAVVMPPLALAMALVLAGILVWLRARGEAMSGLGAPAAGYLAAVAAYVALAVAASIV